MDLGTFSKTKFLGLLFVAVRYFPWLEIGYFLVVMYFPEVE
jgi:hypothetical protein